MLCMKTGGTFSLIDHDNHVTVKILKIEEHRAQIGVQAPKHIEVYRNEIYKRRKAELAQQLEAYYYQYRVDDTLLKMKADNISKQPKKILLIEDNPIISKAHRALLESKYLVEVATDGKQALALFDNSYDLILLDIGLPDIDGTDLCRTIRKQEQNKHIPIIVLTAGGPGIEKECRQAGADDFRVKPLSIEELQLIISYWLAKNLTEKIRREN